MQALVNVHFNKNLKLFQISFKYYPKSVYSNFKLIHCNSFFGLVLQKLNESDFIYLIGMLINSFRIIKFTFITSLNGGPE